MRWLKVGTNPYFPEQGTLQGGWISPTLANIALNGIEKIPNTIRYADDLAIILKPEDDAPLILAQVVNFLDDLGLKIKREKTRLVSATDGFDLLGWHLKVQAKGKFSCVPSGITTKHCARKLKVSLTALAMVQKSKLPNWLL